MTAQAALKLPSKLQRVTFAASGSFHEGSSPTSPLPVEARRAAAPPPGPNAAQRAPGLQAAVPRRSPPRRAPAPQPCARCCRSRVPTRPRGPGSALRLRRPTGAPSQGLSDKFARAKVELDAELLGIAREAQALSEARRARRRARRDARARAERPRPLGAC